MMSGHVNAVASLGFSGDGVTRFEARREELRRAAQEFEAVFVARLLTQMRQAMVPRSSLFGSGTAEEIFRAMMDQEIGKSMARRGGLGLGDAVYRQLLNYTTASADNISSEPGTGRLKG